MCPENLVHTQAVPATEEGCRCGRKQACVSKDEYGGLGNEIFKSLKTSGAIQNESRFIIHLTLEPHKFELQGSAYRQIFFSIVNTTVLHGPQLVESRDVEEPWI